MRLVGLPVHILQVPPESLDRVLALEQLEAGCDVQCSRDFVGREQEPFHGLASPVHERLDFCIHGTPQAPAQTGSLEFGLDHEPAQETVNGQTEFLPEFLSDTTVISDQSANSEKIRGLDIDQDAGAVDGRWFAIEREVVVVHPGKDAIRRVSGLAPVGERTESTEPQRQLLPVGRTLRVPYFRTLRFSFGYSRRAIKILLALGKRFAQRNKRGAVESATSANPIDHTASLGNLTVNSKVIGLKSLDGFPFCLRVFGR